jgi:hypothetical protein
MHKNATKCNETIGKWCRNKHGASKIIDTFETYQWPRLGFSRNNRLELLYKRHLLVANTFFSSYPTSTRRHRLLAGYRIAWLRCGSRFDEELPIQGNLHRLNANLIQRGITHRCWFVIDNIHQCHGSFSSMLGFLFLNCVYIWMYVSRVSKNLYVFSDVLYINAKVLVHQWILCLHLFD